MFSAPEIPGVRDALTQQQEAGRDLGRRVDLAAPELLLGLVSD